MQSTLSQRLEPSSHYQRSRSSIFMMDPFSRLLENDVAHACHEAHIRTTLLCLGARVVMFKTSARICRVS
jgi:hypothetical protein